MIFPAFCDNSDLEKRNLLTKSNKIEAIKKIIIIVQSQIPEKEIDIN